MSTVKYVALIVVFIANFRLCYGKTYKDYILYKIEIKNDKQLEFLKQVEEKKSLEVIFFELPTTTNQTMPLLVHKKTNQTFFEKTKDLKLQMVQVLADVQSAFDKQLLRQGVDESTWSSIPTLEQAYTWLNDTHHKHQNKTSLEIIGKSYDKRPIYAFSIKNPETHDNLKIVVEAGLHGNEWLGTLYSMYYINDLLNSKDSKTIRQRDRFNWYFLPLMNPDGYEYAQKEDRLWTKNRRKIKGMCVGVDLNRNFDYKFGLYDSSRNRKDMHFAGPHAFSEPETQALRDFLHRKRDLLVFYFSLHGYGQKFIIPYSDINKHVSNYLEMQDYASQAAARIRSISGRKFYVGNAYDLYGVKISGDSISWVKKNFYVPYVTGVMFRDDGEKGPAISNEEILPALQEMQQGIISLIAAAPKHLKGHRFSSAVSVRDNVVFVGILAFLLYFS